MHPKEIKVKGQKLGYVYLKNYEYNKYMCTMEHLSQMMAPSRRYYQGLYKPLKLLKGEPIIILVFLVLKFNLSGPKV